MLQCSIERKERHHHMPARVKPAAEAPPKVPPRSSVPGLFGEWIRQGAEGFIATQKILLDLAAQQNALALTMIRERLGGFSPAPSKTLVELAGKGIGNFLEAQKVLLDLAERQNQIVAGGLKPGFVGTPIESFAEVVRQSIDNFIGAQKRFLEAAEKHTEQAVKEFGEGKRLDGSHIAELARQGMQDFVESQKKFLDIVEQQMLVKKEKKAKPGETKKSVDLFEMAREGVDSFVEAQKQLLDLASGQIDVNVRFAREALTVRREQRPATSLSELMRKSVDSFAAAQKALAELASKPRPRTNGAEVEEPELAATR
jgi:hypothetical protein